MSKNIFSIQNEEGVTVFAYKEKQVSENYRDSVHSYDELKFVRIEAGSAVWRVNGADHTVKSGDILIFSRADLRTIQSVTQPLRLSQINFLPAAVYPRQNCTACFYKRDKAFDNLLDRTSPYFDQVAKGYDRIVSEMAGSSPYKEEMILSLLTQTVISAARLFPPVPAEKSSLSRLSDVTEAKNYICKHFAEPLRLSDLAGRYYMSPAHFSRIFKTYSGFTFQQYLARTRVTAVIGRLQNKNQGENILDAAFACGFTSSSGFYRTFKAITGASPKDFE